MLKPLLDDLAAAVSNPSEEVAQVLEGAGHVVHVGRVWPGRAVYLLFAPGGRTPAVVLKADVFERYKKRLRAEYKNLLKVSGRESLKASVPAPVALVRSGERLVLAQTGLDGTPLNGVLRRRLVQRSRTTTRDYDHFVQWLRRFHGESEPATPELLDPEADFDLLSQTLPDGADQWGALLNRARGAGAEYSGLAIPRVWCHGDLGPSNCLMTSRGLGVIDWEGGPTLANPLADLTLFLNYYCRAMPAPGSRKPLVDKAFERSFTGDNWLARATKATYDSELVAHQLPVEGRPYLMLRTLAGMAAGTANTAHSHRPGFRRAYQKRLGIYAKHLVDQRVL